MDDSERSPLLSSAKGKGKALATDNDSLSESTPLLTSSSATPRYDGEDDTHQDEIASVASRHSADNRSVASTASGASRRKPKKGGAPWPSIIAMATLALLAVTIMFGAFFVPAAVEEYAKQAVVLEPTNLSLESITATGVRARIQANFRLEAARVRDDRTRAIGRAATWLVRHLGSDSTNVTVYLPDYDDAVLGSAVVPPLLLSIVDGHNTAVDFVAELAPGEAESIRSIVNDWLDGKLDRLRVLGKADLALRSGPSGIIPLGTHAIAESMVFEASKIPEVPKYNISRLMIDDVVDPETGKTALGADITLTAYNEYPVQLDIPTLGFEILVPNCSPNDPYIPVADAITAPIAVRPRAEVSADAKGTIRELPDSLTKVCPDSKNSPLDRFIKQYLNGEEATVFVRGKKLSNTDTPEWIGELMSSVTVLVPFPGRTFDGFVRDFSLTDVDFSLPDPMAEPDDPASNPQVSGTIQVTAVLPAEMNFELNVSKIRATADVLYKKKKFGELSLHKWQDANSTRIDPKGKNEALLRIQSRVKNAPLEITDADVFSVIVQQLLFGGKDVLLDVDALVAVKVQTALGELTLKDVPAQGTIPVKPIPKDTFAHLTPKVSTITISSTTSTSMNIEALVNITNPTPYSASIPFMSVHVAKNGSVVAQATVERLRVSLGNNTNLAVRATWDPSAIGGKDAPQVARDLISQYLSGYNVSVDVQVHEGSFPSAPMLGRALSGVNLTVNAPRLSFPSGDGDDDDKPPEEGKPDEREHFIRDAVFHLFSSTATFTLVSPLHDRTIRIEQVEATAFYNHTEPVGRIVYEVPIEVPPGASTTPKLPVNWSAGSVGYDAVRKALGGKLRLDARANVTVRIGEFTDRFWYVGRGIGASIRL